MDPSKLNNHSPIPIPWNERLIIWLFTFIGFLFIVQLLDLIITGRIQNQPLKYVILGPIYSIIMGDSKSAILMFTVCLILVFAIVLSLNFLFKKRALQKCEILNILFVAFCFVWHLLGSFVWIAKIGF